MHDGRELTWPVAVVAESPDDMSVVFRTYCSRWPVDGRRSRQASDSRILETSNPVTSSAATWRPWKPVTPRPPSTASRLTATFVNPSARTPPTAAAAELRSFFAWQFSAGGGIGLENCAMTDDGLRCAVEYNCLRWGNHELTPQAGLAVYERGSDGLLAAARIYDDVEPPFGRPYDDPKLRSNHVAQEQAQEDPAERELFETIRTTYPLALEPEQQAMIKELRDRMRTIPKGERLELINDIEKAIGQNLEEEFEF